jgi:hypothetical protein
MFNGMGAAAMLSKKNIAQVIKGAGKSEDVIATKYPITSGMGGGMGWASGGMHGSSRGSDRKLRMDANGNTIPNPTFSGGGSGGGRGAIGFRLQASGAPVMQSPSNVPPQYQPSASGPTYGNISIGKNESINTADYTAENLDTALAGSMKNDWESIAPQLQQLFAQQSAMLGETNSIEQSRVDAANIGYRNHAVQGRQMQRAGVNLSPMQRLAMQSKNSRIAAGGGNAIVNNAVTQRYDQNNSGRANLLAAVNAMKQGSQATLMSVANNQSAREQAYQQANSQRKSSMMGTLAAVGGNLAMQYLGS